MVITETLVVLAVVVVVIVSKLNTSEDHRHVYNILSKQWVPCMNFKRAGATIQDVSILNRHFCLCASIVAMVMTAYMGPKDD